MALKQLPSDLVPIHHSDRGCQYCCPEYAQMLKQRWLSIKVDENYCVYILPFFNSQHMVWFKSAP